MTVQHLIERILIMAILIVTILQLGGAAVRADLADGAVCREFEARKEGLTEKCCRAIGFPHSNAEACQLLMAASRRL